MGSAKELFGMDNRNGGAIPNKDLDFEDWIE